MLMLMSTCVFGTINLWFRVKGLGFGPGMVKGLGSIRVPLKGCIGVPFIGSYKGLGV